MRIKKRLWQDARPTRPYNRRHMIEDSAKTPLSSDVPDADPPTETPQIAENAVDDDAEALQHAHFEIRHDLQKRVDLYLRDRLPDYSRAMLQRLVKNGVEMVNGRAAKSST